MEHTSYDPTEFAWLVRLSRSLLGEANDAEDLAQETVIASLDGGLPTGVPRRAWLASVARRLAFRRFRDESRRDYREKRAARAESVPDSAELVERAEVAERLAACARELPEPYRRTILLRFFEGLSPEEIARDESTPVDTVRWRVRRGLALLREELVRKHDLNWSAWSALLIPLTQIRGGVGVAAIGAPSSVVGTVAALITMKTAILATAIVCGAGLWFLMNPANSEEPTLLGNETPAKEAPPEGSELATLSSPEERAAVSITIETSPPQVSNETATPPALRLLGKVVDEAGEPIAEATVYVLASSNEGAKRKSRRSSTLADTQSNWQGKFSFPREDWLNDRDSGLELGVVANGYVRQVLPNVLASLPTDGLLIVMPRGRTLSGRVVDEFGRGVPDFDLLAHTAYAGIHHVSPSRTLMLAKRAELGSASSSYYQCRMRTNGVGEVVFTGLPSGELTVRSLDPAWSLTESRTVQAESPYTVWTAAKQLGVRLEVFDADTGAPVENVSAVFGFKLTFGNGDEDDFSQWVGRGVGGASFTISSEVLPGLEDRLITSATFYGTVRSEGAKTDWISEPLEDPQGVTGIAEVRVELARSSTEETPIATAVDEPKEPPTSTIELDVRYEDSAPFEGALIADWASRLEGGATLDGDLRPKRIGPGRYQFTVPAGEVQLAVADRNASGSISSWTGQVRCYADQKQIALVTLPRGAEASILRPEGWGGEWFVRANWREPGTEEWQGGLGYSTDEESLNLTVMRPAEWRFQLRRSALSAEAVERIVRLEEGEKKVVED